MKDGSSQSSSKVRWTNSDDALINPSSHAKKGPRSTGRRRYTTRSLYEPTIFGVSSVLPWSLTIISQGMVCANPVSIARPSIAARLKVGITIEALKGADIQNLAHSRRIGDEIGWFPFLLRNYRNLISCEPLDKIEHSRPLARADVDDSNGFLERDA